MGIPTKSLKHKLAAGLLVANRVWDYFESREIKKGTEPRAKLNYYRSRRAPIHGRIRLARHSDGATASFRQRRITGGC
jgi:hypothetical protein